MIEEFVKTIDNLCNLFQDYYREQQKFKIAIIKKNIDDLNLTLENMRVLIISINNMENKRENIFLQLKEQHNLKEEDDFNFLLAKLEKEESKKLFDAREKLKYFVIASQRQDVAIASVLDTQIGIINALLSEVYPERKDALYSNSGFYENKNKKVVNAKIVNYEF